MSHITTSRFPA
jgi:hypothetical protein